MDWEAMDGIKGLGFRLAGKLDEALESTLFNPTCPLQGATLIEKGYSYRMNFWAAIILPR
jgi:hypothetical protein